MANIIDNEIHFSGSAECIDKLRKAFSNITSKRYILLDGISKLGVNTTLYRVFMRVDSNKLSIVCETRWSPISELSHICEQYNVECNYLYYGECSGRMTYRNGKEKWY